MTTTTIDPDARRDQTPLTPEALFTSGALRQAARAGVAGAEGDARAARLYADAARREFPLDKGETAPGCEEYVARIAQLEAALAERTAQYEYSAGVLAAANARLLHPEAEVLAPYLEHPLVEDATAAALRLAERDAALAVAHEALRKIETGARRANERGGSGPCATFVAELPLDTKKALSAPALTRAAEELRLLRELEAEQSYKATAHDPDCQGCRDGVPVVIYGTTRSHVFGEWDMRPCPISPALANLRRFRGEQAPEEPRG